MKRFSVNLDQFDCLYEVSLCFPGLIRHFRFVSVALIARCRW